MSNKQKTSLYKVHSPISGLKHGKNHRAFKKREKQKLFAPRENRFFVVNGENIFFFPTLTGRSGEKKFILLLAVSSSSGKTLLFLVKNREVTHRTQKTFGVTFFLWNVKKILFHKQEK